MGSQQGLLPAYVLSAVAVVAAALGSLVVMETATIKLSVPTTRVVANRTITGGQSGRDLTTTRIEAAVTDSQQGTATVLENSPTYATGKVEFWCSPACLSAQTVTEGTLVNVTNYAKQYKTLAGITVGPQANVHVSVGVSAITAGAAGNTASGSINNINACHLPPCNLKVTNPLSIAGGVDASKSQAIQQADLDSVRASLTAAVTQDLNASLAAQAGGLNFAADGQPTLAITTDHKVGDKVANFTMTMSGALGAVAFSESQADVLMRTAIAQKIPKGFHLTSDLVQTSYVVQHSGANGDVTIKGSATGAIVPSVTADELKSRIKGLRVDAARTQLENVAPGSTVDIAVKPAVPWLPVIQDHISLTIVVEPAAETS